VPTDGSSRQRSISDPTMITKVAQIALMEGGVHGATGS
jgi:hypothetical protein